MTEKERINRDLQASLEMLPEIMIGIQQMLKLVNEQELEYERMDDYTPLNRAIDLTQIVYLNTNKESIEHLIKNYTKGEQ